MPAMAEAGERPPRRPPPTWDAQAAEERQPGTGNPGRRQPLDIGRLAGSADGDGAPQAAEADWPSAGRERRSADAAAARPRRPSWFAEPLEAAGAASAPPANHSSSLPTACAAMGALVLALMIWRVEVVRLLPQTATFYKMVGFDVNLRGLAFKDVKITTETVEGKPVLVIEGVIVGESTPAGRIAAAAFQRERRPWRRDLRLERGTGPAGAEARRARLVQVAAGFAAARRAQYRCALLQQARYRRRQV